jgi:hypothetical protein
LDDYLPGCLSVCPVKLNENAKTRNNKRAIVFIHVELIVHEKGFGKKVLVN